MGNIFTVTSESSPDYDSILVGILRSYTQTNFLMMDAKSFASMSKDQIRRAFSVEAMSEEHAIFKVAKVDFFDLIFEELTSATLGGKFRVSHSAPPVTLTVINQILSVLNVFTELYKPPSIMSPVKLAVVVSSLMARDRKDDEEARAILDKNFSKKAKKKGAGRGRTRPIVSTFAQSHTVTPKKKGSPKKKTTAQLKSYHHSRDDDYSDDDDDDDDDFECEQETLVTTKKIKVNGLALHPMKLKGMYNQYFKAPILLA